jgi:putative chitinase
MSINRDYFFSTVRARLFGGSLKQSQVDGLTAILDEWETEHWDKDDRWLAYALATAYHETDKTMQPIREYGRGKGRAYGKPHPITGQVYYGRGLVQLTWYDNYLAMGRAFCADFVSDPDLVMRTDHAVKIMFEGMMRAETNIGDFTGKCLEMYFNESKDDPVGARRIINGTDKANLIADHHKKFYGAISYTT